MIERWDGSPGLHDVYAAAQAVDDPLGPVLPPRLFLAWLAHGWEDEPREIWFIPGTGWYRLLLPEPENRDRGILDLVVGPTARRRGHGSALLAHALSRAAADGRTLVRGWAWEGSPGESFAVARGGTHDLTRIRRVQDVAAAPRGAAVADGYSLLSWAGHAPGELFDALGALYGAMADAPHSEGAQPKVWDAARVRVQEDLMETFGTREYSVAARHDGTGQLAALTQVGVDPADPEWGYQEISAVIRAHRGHRLGLAVKSAMLDLLASAEPGLRRIVTHNAEDNKHMIAVNEALGYEILGPPMKEYRISVVET